MTIDPVALTQSLIACPSVTPKDAGALEVIKKLLNPLGFKFYDLEFSDVNTPSVKNLYARLGDHAPNFCFAGHTDVVPVGNASAWITDPFAGTITNEIIYGRGTVDMKGAIACFVSAIANFLSETNNQFSGSISLLITGDEEGPAINGTQKLLSWLQEKQEKIEACLIGEPTSEEALGDMIKIGRRGSLNGVITTIGIQGHVAYPHKAGNPIPRLLNFLNVITSKKLDEGTDLFAPSNLEITSIDVGNPAKNIIPATASAHFNIRYNDRHNGQALKQWLQQVAADVAGEHNLDISVSGDSFYTSPGKLQEVVIDSIKEVTGESPTISTSGGTSDARFIHKHCSVIELGLLNNTAHQVNEHAAIADIKKLTQIYGQVLSKFFAIK